MAKVAKADLDCFAQFIKAENMTAWFSFTNEANDLAGTLDADKLEDFATVAHLASENRNLALTVLKNGNGQVNLDTKTLLMSK